MRIVPVTGDLPAVVVPPPAVPPVGGPGRTPPAGVEAVGLARGTSSQPSSLPPHARAPLPFFDPPLIAQRAALGLPVGALIADFARSQGISYGAAAAAVDEELSQQGG